MILNPGHYGFSYVWPLKRRHQGCFMFTSRCVIIDKSLDAVKQSSKDDGETIIELLFFVNL